ncbi:MAG TPA: hypothetical protein VKH18_13535 [Terriglobales bacterium]|nr:hypothetical protein [Terriglobales bacterium]
MRASSHVLVLLCLSTSCLSNWAAAQQSDQVIAERVLGPQWKQLSRRAGIIFAGTVLSAAKQSVATQTAVTDQAAPGAVSTTVPATVPAMELSFRVDRAIAGFEPGQVLTIHEWAGARSMHRPMTKGQHILIFLYPPSRLGLTSPVGGSLGQVALDPSGKNVSEHVRKPAAVAIPRSESSTPRPVPVEAPSVSVVQLERAIRSARSEEARNENEEQQ